MDVVTFTYSYNLDIQMYEIDDQQQQKMITRYRTVMHYSPFGLTRKMYQNYSLKLNRNRIEICDLGNDARTPTVQNHRWKSTRLADVNNW